METYQLNGEKWAAMITQGAENLTRNADFVDSLNVFPVPDGDTGTNMNLSMTSGAKEVTSFDASSVGEVSANFAKGLLMGALGNSGVILSQLFRGFSKAVSGKGTLTPAEFAEAFKKGVETAYQAVMKPVEGTILTVAREAAKAGLEAAKSETATIESVMGAILEQGKIALEKTPEQLSVLKEVGVVDSGGQGLIIIYEGFYGELTGEMELPDYMKSMNELVQAEHHRHVQDFMSTEDITFGYCTEIMVRINETKPGLKPFDEEVFRADLSKMGDSLLVVADDEVAKVHVHTEHPGDVFNYGQQYGSLIKMKVENMREQHDHIVNKPEETAGPKADFGIVTVSAGAGLEKLFKSMGATVVLSGGQTMNPSTEDIVSAVKAANAKQVFVLPNNKNILMAAEQAAAILGEEKVQIIPTKTIPQGLTSLLAFRADHDFAANTAGMIAAISDVESAQITTAVRDTTVEGITIQKDDYIGIIEGKIKVAEKALAQTAVKTLQTLLDENSEIVTIIFGEGASKESAESLAEKIETDFPDVEFEIHEGNQPVYPYIFAVE
ncbi:DAK2 domain-containing protein [Listeria ilorinensis]|uniref:DAK2 domain-containing protein n=1 Tax=Listeria ilorinensis TaxID=2867439 RepID=UPI001EF48DAB|nr:DAK2 domain-containing protein [Listeria ilorinensis]